MNDPYSAYQDLMTALVTRRPDQSAAADDQVVQAALKAKKLGHQTHGNKVLYCSFDRFKVNFSND